MGRKIYFFFSFTKKRDGPKQGVAQDRVPSPILLRLFWMSKKTGKETLTEKLKCCGLFRLRGAVLI